MHFLRQVEGWALIVGLLGVAVVWFTAVGPAIANFLGWLASVLGFLAAAVVIYIWEAKVVYDAWRSFSGVAASVVAAVIVVFVTMVVFTMMVLLPMEWHEDRQLAQQK